MAIPNQKVEECSKCGLYLTVMFCNIEDCHKKYCKSHFVAHIEEHRVEARIKNETSH